MQFVILLYAGHCQQHSEVFFEFELALSLMPYAEMSRFFKTLLMIYFLPLSDSEYLLCSISLSLLALPVTLKKRKKSQKVTDLFSQTYSFWAVSCMVVFAIMMWLLQVKAT